MRSCISLLLGKPTVRISGARFYSHIITSRMTRRKTRCAWNR